MIYLWADTHFNHEGILHHTKRPWATVEGMNYALVQRWNARVKNESDDVWFLGDFGFHAPTKPGTDDLGELFWRLRGRKHLVVGNHDEKNQQVLRLPWESVERLVMVKHQGTRAVLCHYPLESWNGMHYGTLHFHGHCHGTLRRLVPHRFDVGVESFPDGPIEWDYLVATARCQEFKPVDHHGEGA